MRLAAAGVLPFMLDAVLLTHLHSDHICDLNDVVTTQWVMSPVAEAVADLRTAAHARGRRRHARDAAARRRVPRSRITTTSTWEPQLEVVEVDAGRRARRGRRCASSPRRTDHRPAEPTHRIPDRVRRQGGRARGRHRAVRRSRRALSRRRRLRADGAARRPRAAGSDAALPSTRSTTTRRSCRPRRPRRAAGCARSC